MMLALILALAQAFPMPGPGSAPSGGGPNYHSQGTSQTSSGATTTNSLAFASNVSAGHLITAVANAPQTQTISNTGTATISWTAFCINGNSSCTGNASVDSNGCVHDISGANIGYACAWFGKVTGSGTLTVTVTTAANNLINLWIDEWINATATYDVSVTSNGNSAFNTTATSGASGAAAGATELIVGYCEDAGVGTITYTPTGSVNTNSSSTKLYQQQVMYNLNGSSGAQTISATLSAASNWMCGGGAFK